MGQCQGTTRKGKRCKRAARGGSAFCSIHSDQEVRGPTRREPGTWDAESIAKAALGLGLLAAIVLFRIRR